MKRVALAALALAIFVPRPGLAGDAELKQAGDIAALGLPAVAAGIAALHRDSEGFVAFSKSYTMEAVLVFSLKKLVPVKRPREDSRSTESFMSGHTASTASAAAFLHRRYGWRYGLPAYAVAAFTAYTRVQVDAHRPIEVIGSALVAMTISYAVTAPADQGVFIEPMIGRGGYGARVTLTW